MPGVHMHTLRMEENLIYSEYEESEEPSGEEEDFPLLVEVSDSDEDITIDEVTEDEGI
jgi:hypothetical protein